MILFLFFTSLLSLFAKDNLRFSTITDASLLDFRFTNFSIIVGTSFSVDNGTFELFKITLNRNHDYSYLLSIHNSGFISLVSVTLVNNVTPLQLVLLDSGSLSLDSFSFMKVSRIKSFVTSTDSHTNSVVAANLFLHNILIEDSSPMFAASSNNLRHVLFTNITHSQDRAIHCPILLEQSSPLPYSSFLSAATFLDCPNSYYGSIIPGCFSNYFVCWNSTFRGSSKCLNSLEPFQMKRILQEYIHFQLTERLT